MKRIGLVTSWKNNYGSVLQCYATKSTLQHWGYECDVIYEINGKISKVLMLPRKLLQLLWRSVRYRDYLKNYLRMRNALKTERDIVSWKSLEKLDLFSKSILQPRGYSWKRLCEIGKSDNYIAFIAGSDQIWNASRSIQPIYFLEFAKKDKRIALAASFGVDTVPAFNIKSLKKGILGFSLLSVREESGVNIIEKLVNKTVQRIADPTLLLTAEDWRAFSANAKTVDEPYILVHFLNEPNEIAMEMIECFSKKLDCKVVCFAYYYDKYQSFKNYTYMDGRPQEYVSLIDNAKVVCTDSFHSTMFSINMKTSFFVFERQYLHNSPQASRIRDLLVRYGLNSRMICEKINLEEKEILEIPNYEKILIEERKQLTNYLFNAVVSRDKKDTGYENYLADVDDCTGCGVCVAVCPKGAIKFIDNNYGYSIPIIDKEKCVNCGRCKQYCKAKYDLNNEGKITSYIAYNINDELRAKAASGGVFSALASFVLDRDGVVIGASANMEDGAISVSHEIVSKYEDLPKLLGSKYVQSENVEIYIKIKELLEGGKLVLFSGTSCQVDAVYRYLGDYNYDNLLTVDLICHGVPGKKLFRDYIFFLEKKYNGKVVDFSFRRKEDGTIYFEESVDIKVKNKIERHIIPYRKSPYYRMFFEQESYREGCYNCKFASINKPADITIGDYFEAKEDYPEYFNGKKASLGKIDGISCMMVRTKKGKEFIKEIEENLVKFPVETSRVQLSHNNLCHPSVCSEMRSKVFTLYQKRGIIKIKNYYFMKDALVYIPKKILCICNRIIWKE